MEIILGNDFFNNKHVELLENTFTWLKKYAREAAINGEAAHKVEKQIFDIVLKLGQQAMGQFFAIQGNGDVGKKMLLANGKEVQRSQEKHSRIYRSIFGNYKLERYVYWERENQVIACAPLDARLQLPENEYSYLLQEWCQILAIETPFDKVKNFLQRMLAINVTVDSIENVNRAQAESVEGFREARLLPPTETEGELLVHTADGKGVPIRHEKDVAKIYEHRKKRGPKPDRKRMATVGAVYTVDRYERTPEQIAEALFAEPQLQTSVEKKLKTKRPKPRNKQVIANMTRPIEGTEIKGTELTFEWMKKQVAARDPTNKKEHVVLMDGQLSLWEQQKKHFPKKTCIEILDLLHATSYLWDAAALFHPNAKVQQEDFMKSHVLKVLHGDIKKVIKKFRKMVGKEGFKKSKHEQLEKICGYFHRNRHRMKYHNYLAAGYPIASGVIEGACRHFVKDRMERAGMRWTIKGAQAMLDTRSVFLNEDWDEFTKYRIERETERLYPEQFILGKIKWALAA
jgi:hypothetical protein